jgi:hypothetical protein
VSTAWGCRNKSYAENNLLAGLTTNMETTGPFEPAWGSAGAFTAAVSCDQCHAARDGEDALRDTEDNDISPPHDWRHSIMAHAFDDPYFQAVMEEESGYRFPALAGAIEDKCLSCHAPMGHLNAHATGTGLDADGYYRYTQAVQDMEAREAIGCTLCHQIEATATDNDGQPIVGDEAQSGHFTVGDARIIYGPYGGPGDTPVRAGPMQMILGYTPQYGRIATDGASLAQRCFATDKPADFSNQGCYEPHRDRIDAEQQVTIYEAVLADTRDHITHVLLYANRYLKDNRLPPQGFTSKALVDTTGTVGIGGDANMLPPAVETVATAASS